MPPNTRTTSQREAERAEIARLHLTGSSEWQIAHAIGRSRDLVHYDLRVLRSRWRQQSSLLIAEAQARLIAKAQLAQQAAWTDYEASGKDREITTTRQRRRGLTNSRTDVPLDQTNEATKRVEESRGRDPAYLDAYLRAVKLEADLLGVTTLHPEQQPSRVIEIHYETTEYRPDQGRLTIIGAPQPALPDANATVA